MASGDAIGLGVVALAYVLTWLLLLSSLRIVRIIDREGLRHARQIQQRLRRRKTSKDSGRDE